MNPMSGRRDQRIEAGWLEHRFYAQELQQGFGCGRDRPCRTVRREIVGENGIDPLTLGDR